MKKIIVFCFCLLTRFVWGVVPVLVHQTVGWVVFYMASILFVLLVLAYGADSVVWWPWTMHVVFYTGAFLVSTASIIGLVSFAQVTSLLLLDVTWTVVETYRREPWKETASLSSFRDGF